MWSGRNNFFGYLENWNPETTHLGTKSTPVSRCNESSHEKTMTTETRQSSREGQKRAQETNEKQPIVYEDKAQNIGNLVSSSFVTNRNKGLTEAYNLNITKTSGKTASNKNQRKCEKQPIVYEDKDQGTNNLDSSSVETNGKKGITDPCKLKTLKTSGKTFSFENQSKCDQKKSSIFQFPQKFVEVSEDEKIVHSLLKGTESATYDADNTHVSEPIKESTNVKPMNDSTKESQKKNNVDSQTNDYIAKMGENKESIKTLIKNESENQFQPVMKRANPTDTNESDVSKKVADCYLEEKATELAKINDFNSDHETNITIANSLNKDSLSCKGKDEKDNQNSARPLSPYPDISQSVPAEDINHKTIAMNENSMKPVHLACIEEEKNDNPNLALPRPKSPYPEILQSVPTLDLDRKTIAMDENSTERKYMATSLEEKKEKPNSVVPRPRSPYPDFLHTVPEVLSSTAKCLNPIPEIPISKTNGTSKGEITNPVDKKPLNSALHIKPYDSPDSSVPEILSPATKRLIPVHDIPLYATNGVSKNDKTNSNEEKPLNSTLRLISYSPPDSSASETSDTETGVELKKIAIVPPVPTIPIPAKNGKRSKRMSEILSSIPNPFKWKSKSYSPQSKSGISKADTNEEIQNMTEFQSQQPTNQSIYKLAYNESITDSSSTHSRSLSPVDREKLIPRNTFHDEIVVYEAESDSEPGSEDLELLPHRYDCDTFQTRENNLYINKLSLAVELIRTQEELPYDDQFKRIVEDDPDPYREASGEENLAFAPESPGWNVGNGSSNSPRNIVVTSPPRRSDNLATTGVTATAVDMFTDSCEEAGIAESRMPTHSRDMTEETQAISRRVRGHMRHYLSSRTFGNPCLCCIIM